jgi:enterochelin esterase-like enzyme
MQRWQTILAYLGMFLAGGAVIPVGAAVELLSGLDFGRVEAREVRIYVPDKVTASTPVLVALDGQNMEAWRLEAALAHLKAQGRRVPLVIAIPSGRDRVEEYGLAGVLDYASRGRLAVDFQRFVTKAVLPAVRARYGILADPKRTGIMGSSLGGLAAFDLAWRHPEVFGFAGVFSGSFWWRGEDGSAAVRQSSRLAHRQVRAAAPRTADQRWWFSVGTKEETDDRDGNGVIDAVQDTSDLVGELESKGAERGRNLHYVLVEGGEHHETAWADLLPGFLAWALSRD